MANYKYVGYFNGIDAIIENKKTAEEVVADMNNGIGNFHKVEHHQVESDAYLKINLATQTTNDGKHIIVYDVADKFADVDINDSNNYEFENEFVDVYEKLLS